VPFRLLVRGWRFLPHSYAVVNAFQCLELGRRADIALRHADAPHFKPRWAAAPGLLPQPQEQFIAGLRPPEPSADADAEYRISYPPNFAPSRARLFVFMTNDYTPPVEGSLREAQAASRATIVTPSHWAHDGLVRNGADPARTVVVPHGVDPALFQPLAADARAELRRRLGWQDRFVLLSIGAMSMNKGPDLLLRAFAVLAGRHPHIVLLLKGLDALYPSHASLQEQINLHAGTKFRDRVIYSGQSLTFAETARLYQLADAYVAPYRLESFNLPVLEAAACGLPIVTTAGGPTDEFTEPSFAFRVESRQLDGPRMSAHWRPRYFEPAIDHLVAHMERVITDDGFRASARRAAVAHAQNFTWARAVDRLVSVLGV
jgi:glycosyltransferase involved in cell wall biosynthesis